MDLIEYILLTYKLYCDNLTYNYICVIISSRCILYTKCRVEEGFFKTYDRIELERRLAKQRPFTHSKYVLFSINS